MRHQSWFEASLHMHSRLILRADEYAETLQWNICRGTVASVTAVVEHDVPIAKYIWSLGAPVHDPQLKLHLEVIPGIYQFDAIFSPFVFPLSQLVFAGTTLAFILLDSVFTGRSCL
jgi:hypothetical protein